MSYLESFFLRRSIPIPNITGSSRVLAVQAHADDVDIAWGASAAMLASRGAQIIYVTVTDELGQGELLKEGETSIRREEQRAAAKLLGISSCIFLGRPDAGDWDEHELMLRLCDLINDLEPDILLCPDPNLLYEAHPDHLKTGRAASAAAVLHRFLSSDKSSAEPLGEKAEAAYELPAVGYYFTGKANRTFSCRAFRGKKFEAVAAHRSQFTENSLQQVKTYDTLHNRTQSFRKLLSYREGLKIVPSVLLHCVSGTAEY